MTAPLTDWEDELGRLSAHRLCARATRALACGQWGLVDLEDAIEAVERRLTGRQRVLLWEALTGDPALSEVAARASHGEGSSLI